LLFAQRCPGLFFGLKAGFGLRDLSQRRIPPCFQLRSDKPVGRINCICIGVERTQPRSELSLRPVPVFAFSGPVPCHPR
jgi:hypothetical protein